MAQISIGGALGSGFGVIRRRPLLVLLWGFIPMLLAAAGLAVMAPTYLAIFGAAAQQAQSGAAGTPPDMSALMPQMMMTSGLSWLINLGQLLVSAIINCAVWRAVLHPEKRGFAYLQLGAPELLFMVLTVAAIFALIILLFLVMIPVAILVGVTAGVSGANHGGAAAVALMIPIVMLVVAVLLVLIGLRFVFIGPMMVDDGKFHFGESWTLTKGHVGALFVIVLGLIGIALVLELLIGAIMVGLGAAGFMGVIGGANGLPAFLRLTPMEMLTRLAPLIGTYFVLLIPLNGCFLAIFGAPWARAYRDLKPDDAAAFA